MVELALLSISSLTNVLLGLVVYVKNPKSATNQLFLLLTFSFSLWSVVNYISVHPIWFEQIVWVRLVLFCAALLCLSVYLTFTVFPSSTLVGRRDVRRLAIATTAFVMSLTLTPYVFTVNEAGDPVPNFAIPVFALLVVSLLGTGIYNLVKKYRRSRGKQKLQFRLVLLGLAGTFSLIFLANFLMVVVFNVTALIPLGPTFTLLFSGSLAYAIIKHRLFDIRAAIARAVAYLLALGTIILIYSGIVFGLSETLIGSSETTVFQRAFYIACAVLTSFIYQPVKKFFDRLTNHIFFQDAYDPEVLIDQLNRVLVANAELDPILRKSSGILETNFKAEFCVFGLHETRYTPSRNIGAHGAYQIDLDAELLEKHAAHIRHHTVVTEELLDNPRHHELSQLLQENNVALLVRLVATVQHNAENIGYLMLGPKRSGNAYTTKDVNLVNILANELVIAVENALRFEEIENFNITLQQKVDEATRQLKRTNEKLKALDETKDEFISMASHQLRTPLTSVKGYLSMVLEGDTGKVRPAQRKLLDQAFASSQRMVYLIADLLNVSRLRTGKFVIEPVLTNLADVVEGEVEQLIETAESRDLKLTYHKPKDFPPLMLDETKLRQVIMNFTDNAIYYTPSGGSVRVELKDTGPTIEFTVTDDGIGVPKHEQHHLFNKFYRANNARKARPDGTGLGLFMAKKVIVAQGGSLIFKSREGKGSTFGFSFAKSKLRPPTTA